jgi:hypothetical protein
MADGRFPSTHLLHEGISGASHLYWTKNSNDTACLSSSVLWWGTHSFSLLTFLRKTENRRMSSPCDQFVWEFPLSTFECLNQFSWNLAPETIWTAYFINVSYQTACLLMLLGNSSLKHYRGNEYTCNNRRIIGRAVFCAVRVCESVCVPLIVARQRIHKYVPAATRIVGGVVFYAIRDSKEK